jgi:hypothetical protein
MHLHNRPHFKLQDDDVTCSLHSAGDDLEQLLVSIDVNDLRKLILSTTACSATFVTSPASPLLLACTASFVLWLLDSTAFASQAGNIDLQISRRIVNPWR